MHLFLQTVWKKQNCCNCTLFDRFHIWRKYESKSPVQKPACITCLHDFFWSTILCHLHLWSEYCHLPVVVLWQYTKCISLTVYRV